eukprot:6193424-Pleurochrysis_carterae.AAC.3
MHLPKTGASAGHEPPGAGTKRPSTWPSRRLHALVLPRRPSFGAATACTRHARRLQKRLAFAIITCHPLVVRRQSWALWKSTCYWLSVHASTAI